jgi:hypothetical protein
MAQSSEYKDLKWVAPRSWTNANRSSVQLVVIHDTEGSAHAQSAEDGAAYDARRTDGTSTHYFHDSNSTVQCVLTADQAHTARSQGNRRGIHHELCARASWSRAKWLDADYGLPMLKVAAKQCARDAKKWGIPIRKLSVEQVRSGVKGFCGHADITRAFPADRGSHTDPGPNFPWADFIGMVKAAAGTASTPAPQRKVDFVQISGELPILRQNDTDDTVPGGTVWIRRAQAELDLLTDEDVTVDGDYGKGTAAAVKELMADDPERTTSNGSIIGLPEWRRLYGIWA